MIFKLRFLSVCGCISVATLTLATGTTLADGCQPSSVGTAKEMSLKAVWGEPVELHGELKDSSGKAIAAAQVEIARRSARIGSPWKKVSVTEPDAAGKYLVKLDTSLGSASYKISYSGGYGYCPSEKVVQLLLPTKFSSFRVTPSRNIRSGRKITIKGRIVGPRDGSLKGRTVVIKYNSKSTNRWLPVTIGKADGRGHFSIKYRFGAVIRSGQVTLRAETIKDVSWEDLPGFSKARTIRVRAK